MLTATRHCSKRQSRVQDGCIPICRLCSHADHAYEQRSYPASLIICLATHKAWSSISTAALRAKWWRQIIGAANHDTDGEPFIVPICSRRTASVPPSAFPRPHRLIRRRTDEISTQPQQTALRAGLRHHPHATQAQFNDPQNGNDGIATRPQMY